MKLLQMCIYKDASTNDYLPNDRNHPESSKKNENYNLSQTIVFVIDPEKVELRLNKLKALRQRGQNIKHILLVITTYTT